MSSPTENLSSAAEATPTAAAQRVSTTAQPRGATDLGLEHATSYDETSVTPSTSSALHLDGNVTVEAESEVLEPEQAPEEGVVPATSIRASADELETAVVNLKKDLGPRRECEHQLYAFDEPPAANPAAAPAECEGNTVTQAQENSRTAAPEDEQVSEAEMQELNDRIARTRARTRDIGEELNLLNTTEREFWEKKEKFEASIPKAM